MLGDLNGWVEGQHNWISELKRGYTLSIGVSISMPGWLESEIE